MINHRKKNTLYACAKSFRVHKKLLCKILHKLVYTCWNKLFLLFRFFRSSVLKNTWLNQYLKNKWSTISKCEFQCHFLLQQFCIYIFYDRLEKEEKFMHAGCYFLPIKTVLETLAKIIIHIYIKRIFLNVTHECQ